MNDGAESTKRTDSESETSERERIRERKLAELRERLDEDGSVGSDKSGEGRDEAAESDGTTAPTEPIEVDGPDAFQRAVSEHEVVLVDCYADWCGPCQMMEPTVSALASETDAAVVKVDVDANPGLAQRLGARSIPTLLLYVDGDPADRFVGAQDRATLESAIASHAE